MPWVGGVSDAIYAADGEPDAGAARLGGRSGWWGRSLCSAPVLFVHGPDVGRAVALGGAFFFAELTIGPMWAIPMDIAPRFSGTASGLMNSGSALAAIISPVVFGWIIDKTGNWSLPFYGTMGFAGGGGGGGVHDAAGPDVCQRCGEEAGACLMGRR